MWTWKLGRHKEAMETARIAVSPEQRTVKKTTLWGSHTIIGQVTAKRGEYDEADASMKRAMEEARLSRLPMLELLAVGSESGVAFGVLVRVMIGTRSMPGNRLAKWLTRKC